MNPITKMRQMITTMHEQGGRTGEQLGRDGNVHGLSGVFKQAAALKLQVDVSFKTHHKFLVQHGLPDCTSVLDGGTGNGYFCFKLAELYPYINFVGVDFMEDMLQRARDEMKRLNISNMQLIATDMRMEHALGQAEQFDGILLRYAAYHIKEIKVVLEYLKGLLKHNGRIWIIDEEFDYMQCEPRHEAFYRYKRGTERLYDKFGSDYHCGSKLPLMLKSLGYREIEMELDPMSNRDVPLEDYQRYMAHEALLIHKTDPTSITSEDLEMIRDFIENIVPSPNYYGTYGHVMITARK